MHINDSLWERELPGRRCWLGLATACCLVGFEESLGDPNHVLDVQERAFLGGTAEPGRALGSFIKAPSLSI